MSNKSIRVGWSCPAIGYGHVFTRGLVSFTVGNKFILKPITGKNDHVLRPQKGPIGI